MFKRKHPATGHRSIVNLKSGEAVDGVITQVTDDCYVIMGASLLTPGQNPSTMDGTVLVERENVSFIQLHG